jgi:hypothetical protein
MSDENRTAREQTAPRRIENHICDHSSGCKKVAMFGVNTRYGTLWYCSTDHMQEAEKDRVPGFGT